MPNLIYIPSEAGSSPTPPAVEQLYGIVLSDSAPNTFYKISSIYNAVTEVDEAKIAQTLATKNLNVLPMTYFFAGCNMLTGPIDLSSWTAIASKFTDCSYMFQNCSKLTGVSFRGLNLSAITNIAFLFSNCSALQNIDFTNVTLNTNLKTINAAFAGCSALTSLDLTIFKTLKPTNMNGFLQNCSSLQSIDVKNMDVSACTNLSTCFRGCSDITELDLTGWSTASCTGMQNFVQNCSSLAKMWVPSTFVATAVSSATLKPFYNSTGKTGGTHIYTDAVDATTQGWGTINSNYIMHYNATYADYLAA